MAKLIVYLAFIICCNRQQNGAAVQGGVVADVITDYKTDKLWADGLLMKATQVEECMFISQTINLDTIF
ncbi:unnamed protein product [Brugia pahangi]|uniref:Secreted protein n=1 Tax=Brugia pahangi TaxID=6280 RepID=A0A0N4TRN9_BRUPA|nr:unnamed protein product [Brugia pahangi]